MPADYGFDDAVRRYGRNNVEHCIVDAAFKDVYPPEMYVVYVKPGVRYRKAVMPHSEVNMHMKIAGKPMDFEIIPSERGYAPSVQLYQPDTDLKFSAPITYGEAGVYFNKMPLRPQGWHNHGGHYYFYPNFPSAEPDPAEVVAVRERLDII